MLRGLFEDVAVIQPDGNTSAPPAIRGLLSELQPEIDRCLRGEPFETRVGGRNVRGVRLEDGSVALGFWTSANRWDRDEFAFLANQMRHGIWRLDQEGRIVFANKCLANWLDTTPEAMAGSLSQDYLERVEPNGVIVFRAVNGMERRAEVKRLDLPSGWRIDVLTDVCIERNRAELLDEVRRMALLARTDPLTGLANRIGLDEGLRNARESGEPHALVMADIDDFKEINDTYGHAAGDKALIELARRLRSAVRETDVVARLGGDEVAVLLTQADPRAAEEIFRRLWARMQFVLETGDVALPLKVSAGWAHSEDHPNDLVAAADFEMYREKRRRKGEAE